MMDKRSILKNLSVAFGAQGLSMLIGAAQSLLVPRVLGLEQFGYWQLYLFYASYVGFFHFGLSSGVYLEMGGLAREEMDKAAVKSQFLFGLAFQSAIAVAISAGAWALAPDPERRFILAQVGLVLVLKNAATYLMNVLQCMNETRRSSASTMVERLCFMGPLLAFMVLRLPSYRPYVIAYTLASAAQVAFCLWHLRDFASAGWLGMRRAARMGLRSISSGISLMLANVAGMLIMGGARFVIDARWGIETFGKLSLVMSLVNMFLAFVSQAGMVLFPALRQGGDAERRAFFVAARDALSLAFPAVYLLYFPMVWALGAWLPAYADALPYLAVLLLVCVFDSKMTVTGTTYFNVLRRERAMLALNAAAAALSLALAFLGAYVIDSVTALLVGVVAAIALRSLVAEAYLSRELGVARPALALPEVALTALFVASARLLPAGAAVALYAVAYALYLYCFRGELSSVLQVAGVRTAASGGMLDGATQSSKGDGVTATMTKPSDKLADTGTAPAGAPAMPKSGVGGGALAGRARRARAARPVGIPVFEAPATTNVVALCRKSLNNGQLVAASAACGV